MPTHHERLFHGIGAGDDLGRGADRPRADRRPHLLGEPDAAGPLRRVPGRPPDLGRADRGRLRRLARQHAPHRDRVGRVRRVGASVHPGVGVPRRLPGAAAGGQGCVRPRRCGDHRAELGRGDRRARSTTRRGSWSPTATCASACTPSAGSTPSATTRARRCCARTARRLRYRRAMESRHERLPRRLASAPGPVRHPASRRPARGAVHERGRDRRLGPRVHRADGHVLPRHRGRRGQAAVLLQGRGARIRPRPRRAHDRVSQLRRQRHVPVGGQRVGQPSRRAAVHRLRQRPPISAATQRHRLDRRARRADGRLPGGTVRRPRPGHPGVPELPPLHPPHAARGTLAVRARAGPGDAGAGLEAHRLGLRRAAGPG